MDQQELQSLLWKEIPITESMGIHVLETGPREISLTAPLEKNINHKSTAFGGSLYSVAVLTGWSLLKVFLVQRGVHAHIVIQESKMQYLKPVKTDIVSHCEWQSEEQEQTLLKSFQRKKRARTEISVNIVQLQEVVAIFHGQYVIHA